MELKEQLREWRLRDILHVSQETVRSRSRMSSKLKSELELAKELGTGRDRKVSFEVALRHGSRSEKHSEFFKMWT